MEDPPLHPNDDPIDRADEMLQTLIPNDPNKPYDMKELIYSVIDNHNFFRDYALLCTEISSLDLPVFDGHPVGIVANQPGYLAGVLDSNSSVKAARFVRFCDAFNIPLVTFEDVPGFLPGTSQEFGGIIRHGAKLLFAFCEATVPKNHYYYS